MRLSWTASLGALVSLMGCAGALATAPVWLAVSPDQKLLDALSPLAEHRRAGGFKVVTATSPVDEAIVNLGAPPDYLLLVGDEQLIPARRGSQYRWRSVQRETFAADPLFSDLDHDGLAEFPVGRIPVSSPQQLAVVVAKTIAYENRQLSIADLNLPVWSGTPAYGKLLDETADWLLMSSLDKHAPRWAQPWLLTANPRNVLNGWPTDHATLFNHQLVRGAAFITMIGHGDTSSFLSMRTPTGDLVYGPASASWLDDPDLVSAPLVIFACDCGNFAHDRKQSLAGKMLLNRGGPVLTIAATTESHPLTNYYSSLCLMAKLSEPSTSESRRAGDIWLAAQLAAVKMRKPLIERLLKNAEGSLENEIDIPKLKRDQTQMYAFLGDPALEMTLPQELETILSQEPDKTSQTWIATKPEGATRLVVQLRRKSKPLRVMPEGATRAEALRLFEQRNSQFAYATVAEFSADEPWSGVVREPGDLRLVAIGPGSIHTFTEELK